MVRIFLQLGLFFTGGAMCDTSKVFFYYMKIFQHKWITNQFLTLLFQYKKVID